MKDGRATLRNCLMTIVIAIQVDSGGYQVFEKLQVFFQNNVKVKETLRKMQLGKVVGPEVFLLKFGNV